MGDTRWCTRTSRPLTDPIPTYTYLATQLGTRFPTLAHLHVNGATTVDIHLRQSNDIIRGIWGPRPLTSTGGYRGRPPSRPRMCAAT
ncbi:NADH flavin oxidoreductase/NADH oxidase [Mycena kentingensis (nom. inval.)]|nr:NADH flavin oxidoreductase/NADH oxidase [Mycena kentingensis (nom. inval.)]